MFNDYEQFTKSINMVSCYEIHKYPKVDLYEIVKQQKHN